MNVGDIVRQQIIADIVSRMSDDEKRDYILLSSNNQIKDAISNQDIKLDELLKRNNWKTSFVSDVGANVLTNAAFLLIAKLFK